MFNMPKFIKENLINGYWDESFTKAQVNMFALNFFTKAIITQEDINEIFDGIEEPEDEPIE